MATGTIKNNYRGWTYRMYWSSTPSVENNNSALALDHWLDCEPGYDLYIGERDLSSTVGSDVKYDKSPAIATGGNQSFKLGTTSHVIPHDDDGTKSITLKGIFDIEATLTGVWVQSIEASGTITLDTIARASQPSCVTWPEHTQNVGNFGDKIAIHMNRKSDSFTHTVRYAFGDLTGTIATGVTTGTEWTIPLSFMNKIPNALKGSGTIYVDTYKGTTKVGTKSCSFTATVPASIKPTVSATLEDVTEAGGIYGAPVAGLSKIKVTPSVTLAYSSPIKSYRITINGRTYNTNGATTDILQKAGTSPVIVTVTDSRGRSGSWTYNMNVLPYTRPQIPLLAVHRTNGDWEENDQGDHVMVTFSIEVSPMDDKNLADYTLRYKKTTEDSWSTIDLSEIDHNFNVYNYAVLFEADVSASYDVELTAADRHHSATRSTSASTAFSLMDWYFDGTGIRFGGVAELPNLMDVALRFRLTGGILPVEIPADADLDEYKTSGWYRCALSATAESLTHCPTDNAFVMEVLPNVPTTQRITEYIEHSAPRVFYRNYYDYADTWGTWYELVPRQANIGNKVNLITLGSSSVYTFPSDGYLVLRAHYSTGSYVNCTVTGANGTGFVLTATSGTTTNLKGNPTDALFVRKGMKVRQVATNDQSQNALEFYPVY